MAARTRRRRKPAAPDADAIEADRLIKQYPETIKAVLCAPLKMPTVVQLASAIVMALTRRRPDEAHLCLAAMTFHLEAMRFALNARAALPRKARRRR